MTLRELVGLGMCELASRAHRGELRGRHVWVGLKGARRYHHAVATGNVAGEDDQAKRASACTTCGHHRTRAIETATGEVGAGYCGEPFEDHEAGGGTCGCLVSVTLEGRTHAAGRAIVASLGCPLRPPHGPARYGPAEPIGIERMGS